MASDYVVCEKQGERSDEYWNHEGSWLVWERVDVKVVYRQKENFKYVYVFVDVENKEEFEGGFHEVMARFVKAIQEWEWIDDDGGFGKNPANY